MAAQALGPKAFCLVDLGHHAPNVNIEMIVARLVHARRLGGFHFNDSKYGDDDLDCGSIDPFRLFLIFNELVDAQWRQAPEFRPAHMLDQSHNALMSAQTLKRAFTTDVQPILARARLQKGAAIDPVGAFRGSGYRAECAKQRPAQQTAGSGIV